MHRDMALAVRVCVKLIHHNVTVLIRYTSKTTDPCIIKIIKCDVGADDLEIPSYGIFVQV